MALTVDIRKKLGDFRLEVSFETDGGPLALLGASGCGKSAALRCIAGVLTPDEGRITLDGRPLFDSAAGIDLPPQRRRVGYLFQQYALFPNMTVAGNIAAAIPDRAGREEKVRRLLERFRLEDAAGRRPAQLSGGQQQRTALARILASEPKAILLDEPFSALDSYLKARLELELAQTLDSFPGPVVWVTHDRGEAFRSCKEVCVLEGGRSDPVRTRSQLFHAPDSEAAARLSGCENFTDAVPQGEAVLLPAWGIRLDWGRPVPAGVRRMGVRARFVLPAEEGAENAFPCAVVRVVEDVFSAAVLLRPEGAARDADPLRMELDKAVWRAMGERERLWAAVPPRDILLFER